jgi:hypothetical protein
MKIIVTMNVNSERDLVKAELSVFDQECTLERETAFHVAEIVTDFLRKRFQNLSLKDTVNFDHNMHSDGTYRITMTVPDKRILKEILNGKELSFGSMYSTAFANQLHDLLASSGLSELKDAEVLFVEPQKIGLINDDLKLSKFILVVIFLTCGMGFSAYGVTLFNLSIIEAALGKLGGLISLLLGILFLSVFSLLFNQPGGRR